MHILQNKLVPDPVISPARFLRAITCLVCFIRWPFEHIGPWYYPANDWLELPPLDNSNSCILFVCLSISALAAFSFISFTASYISFAWSLDFKKIVQSWVFSNCSRDYLTSHVVQVKRTFGQLSARWDFIPSRPRIWPLKLQFKKQVKFRALH